MFRSLGLPFQLPQGFSAAAAKARGVKLGELRPSTITRNDAAKERATAEAETLRPLLTPMVAAGYSLRRMSQVLAAAGKTTRNGSLLSASVAKAGAGRGLGLASRSLREKCLIPEFVSTAGNVRTRC
jgi:hypothetical protein